MYLRDSAEFQTLGDLAEKVADRRLYATGNSVDLTVRLDDGTEESVTRSADEEYREEDTYRRGTITIGKKDVPATKRGLAALASFYDIPTKFLERCHADEQQFIFDHRIQRSQERPIVLRWTEKTGITEVYNGQHTRVTQEAMVDALLEFLPEESTVTDWHGDTGTEWWGSVIVPEGFNKGIGGDKKVGDLTRGGIRFGRNTKQNLAPWVQTYLFRLACTNGMEVPDHGLRVDARGMEEADIVMSFKAEAQRAFDMVSKRIDAFYEMRSEKVGPDRTGIFRKITQEAGLADRVVGRLSDTLADGLLRDQIDEPSMFDFINHITNGANNPGTSPNQMRNLQRAGAGFIHDHQGGDTHRCPACHNRLN